MKEILILGNIRSRSIIYLLANKNNDIFRRQLRIRQGEIGPKFTHAHFHQRHVLALANSRSVYRSVADELRAMVETSSKHENKTEAEKRVERERERAEERKKQKRIETYQNFRYALDPGPLHRGKKERRHCAWHSPRGSSRFTLHNAITCLDERRAHKWNKRIGRWYFSVCIGRKKGEERRRNRKKNEEMSGQVVEGGEGRGNTRKTLKGGIHPCVRPNQMGGSSVAHAPLYRG